MDDPAHIRPVAIGSGIAETISPDRLQELERLAEIGRLSASLLHEINNPLTAAMLWLEQCNGQHPHIRHVRSSIRVLHRYVEAAKQQLRREGRHRTFRVDAELRQAHRVLEPLAAGRGVKLSFASAGGCRLYGDPVKFQQIIANLVRNAIDAYEDWPPGPGNRPVRLDLCLRQDYLILNVSDRGCGMTDEQLKRLFEPFYSTKCLAGKGLGLGLAAVKRFIENDFQGTITVRSSKHGGTTFTAKFRFARPHVKKLGN